MSKDRHGYEGRSHSLWYCDAQEAGRHQWFETAFMIPGIRLAMTRQEPFALKPGEDAAGAGAAAWPDRVQIAWPFTPLNVGELDDFMSRWTDSVVAVRSCPASRAMLSTGTPFADRTDTKVCLISRGTQSSPRPAFLVMMRKARMTLFTDNGVPTREAIARSSESRVICKDRVDFVALADLVGQESLLFQQGQAERP